MLKYLMLTAFCIAGSVYSVASHAQIPKCYNDETGNDYQRSFAFGTVLVPQNAPDGAVLATTILTMPYRCDANTYPPGGYSFYFRNLQRPSGIPGVTWVSTNYPAADSYGIRVTNLETGEMMMVSGGSTQDWAPPNSTTKPIEGRYRLKIELVKINDRIYNAGMPQVAVGVWQIGAKNRAYPTYGYMYQFYWNEAGKGKFVTMPNTCTVTTPDIRFPLPPVAASKLGAVGMTAGDTGFNIGLNCKSGSNVHVTLTDLTNQGNTGNQLTLTPDSSAQGVKLRILRNGQPVGYGPDSAAIGNTNQWYVGPSATVSNIPLTAQYIATGQVSSGTVKGVATFTMSYQ
ncbi:MULTISPECIES: fimbrial protein [unclassified Burkholderia]|uniref:fimbrial protein n=1 Tax=unclassified Burkholderia TaxID=2613784 RepID=UPI001E3576AA|nr:MULTISPECIES: fimbrial protein [unclassified Burkholderia]UEP27787.1 fimbrial protein [Burkholderia sp. B21-007]UEP41326.1 fimbrial protein [Burkholderia sp. B21-005]